MVTAHDDYWLQIALNEFCGYGTSVIACDAEVGVECRLSVDETIDGRVGASVLVFGFSSDAVQKAIVNRTGQCLMTCPTTAVFDGSREFESPAGGDGQVEETKRIALGQHLRFFGDGYQKSKLIGERRVWRIPVMDGEFLVEDTVAVSKGVAGGNFLILSTDQITGLQAARRAVLAIDQVRNVMTPFPGGVVRSGSKVGSRYKALRASTSHTFCPTLKGRVDSKLGEEVGCVYEIVIDGADFECVAEATRVGIVASVGEGIKKIHAGNYGGKLGKYHFHLHEILSETSPMNPSDGPDIDSI